jgi:4-amino-4-deoxy-L-arabinose transferase-like glycosyltransferase
VTGQRENQQPEHGGALERRRARTACLAIFAAALAIRLLNLWFASRSSPFYCSLNTDDGLYHAWAMRIASGTLSDGEPFFLSPLFPYALGLVYTLFGESQLAALLVQIVLSAMTCCFIGGAGRILFGMRAGILAGALAAFYGPFIFFTEILLTETLHLFLACLAFLLFLQCRRKGTTFSWTVCGLVAGLAAATRTYYLLTATLLAAWLVVAGYRRLRESKKTEAAAPPTGTASVVLAPAAAFLGSVLLVVAIPTAHNLFADGGFVLVNSSGGVNFFMGNHAGANGRYHVPARIPIESVQNPLRMRATFRALAEEEAGRKLTASEVSSHYLGKGLSFIASRPGAWLRLLLLKAGYVIESYEFPGDRNYCQAERFSPVLAWTPVRFPLILGLALLGFLATRRRRFELAPLYLTGLAAFAVLIGFYVTDRYRLALLPALILLAGAGISFFWKDWAERRRARALAGLAAGAALFSISLALPNLLTDDFRTESSMSLYNLGTQFIKSQRYAEAEEALLESIGVEKNYLPAWNNLAKTLSAMPHRRADAIKAWRTLLLKAREQGSRRFEERAEKYLRQLGAASRSGE